MNKTEELKKEIEEISEWNLRRVEGIKRTHPISYKYISNKAELKGRQDAFKEVIDYLDNNCFTREDILKFKKQLKQGDEK